MVRSYGVLIRAELDGDDEQLPDDEELAQQIGALLCRNLGKKIDCRLNHVVALPDPLFVELDQPYIFESLLSAMRSYYDRLREEVQGSKFMRALTPATTAIGEGLTDMGATIRTIQVMAMASGRRIRSAMLEEGPIEMLHELAHSMGLPPDQCQGMTREDFVKFIKDRFGPKRDPHKVVN